MISKSVIFFQVGGTKSTLTEGSLVCVLHRDFYNNKMHSLQTYYDRYYCWTSMGYTTPHEKKLRDTHIVHSKHNPREIGAVKELCV